MGGELPARMERLSDWQVDSVATRSVWHLRKLREPRWDDTFFSRRTIHFHFSVIAYHLPYDCRGQITVSLWQEAGSTRSS